MKAWQRRGEKATLIGHRYHILRILGRGSIAITYLAFDDKANESGALKPLSRNC